MALERTRVNVAIFHTISLRDLLGKPGANLMAYRSTLPLCSGAWHCWFGASKNQMKDIHEIYQLPRSNGRGHD